MGLVGTAGELVAPAADLVIHGAVQLALGAVGLAELFAQHVEHLMLQTLLPFLPRFIGGGLEALQLMRFEVFAALVKGGVVLRVGIEGIAEVGVHVDELAALLITQAAGLLRARVELNGERGGHFDGFAPARGLLAFGGDARGDFVVGKTMHKHARGLAGDAGLLLLKHILLDGFFESRLLGRESGDGGLEAADAFVDAFERGFLHAEVFHRLLVGRRGEEVPGLLQLAKFFAQFGQALDLIGTFRRGEAVEMAFSAAV